MSESSERRPNMQQIGDAAGVSKSAVSLALRNDPRIPEATRMRIQRIADDLGYKRNPVVDSLMTQLRAGRQPSFQSNLALINCSSVQDLRKEPSFRQLCEGVHERAEALGYGVEEFWLGEAEMAPAGLKKILETRGIRGLILIASPEPGGLDPSYMDLWHGFACAAIGGAYLSHRLSCASNDQYLTARRATEKVLELGYSRPLLVIPQEDDALLEEKFSAGYRSIVEKLPAADRLGMVPLNLADPGAALLAIRQLKPDVVITNQSALYDWLHDDGVSLPKDVGFVHLDWDSELSDLAGMRQNSQVVGRAGVDLVVAQLQKNESGLQEFPKVVQIESAWVDGPSVKASSKTARKTTTR